MARYFFDTEFMEDGKTIELISIGIVCEDGSTYYAENSEADLSKANDWVKENVLPHLRPNYRHTREDIARTIKLFVGDNPEFWAYYADYDWVVLCQLYGTMLDLPEGWPMFCLDLKQWCYQLGDPRLPKQIEGQHDAYHDALWNREVYKFLNNYHV